jgi:hypothetical protein
MLKVNMFLKWGILLSITLLPAMYAIGIEGHLSTKDYIDGLMAARASAAQDTANTFGILLAVLTAIISLLGFGVYKVLRNKLNSVILDDIREAEIRSLIGLGLINYQLFTNDGQEPAVKHSAINSAIAHTEHSLTMARNKLSNSNKNRLKLIAITAANLAYYYVELSDITETSSIQDKQRTQASKCLDISGIEIDAVIRTGGADSFPWYSVDESRLYVRLRTRPENLDKEPIFTNIKALLDNQAVPSKWREKIKTKWITLGYGE